MEEKKDKKKPGLKPGHTNNPNGRPKGSLNKVQATVKSRIVGYIEDDFDNFLKEVKKLKTKDRVKAKLELIKLVVPRPLNEEEKDAYAIQSELVKKLFRENEG